MEVYLSSRPVFICCSLYARLIGILNHSRPSLVLMSDHPDAQGKMLFHEICANPWVGEEDKIRGKMRLIKVEQCYGRTCRNIINNKNSQLLLKYIKCVSKPWPGCPLVQNLVSTSAWRQLPRQSHRGSPYLLTSKKCLPQPSML